ncbi:hypothetical protein AWC38_SpisGene24504 [Stylophora pistillata]|uniref:Immunoglobulin V-set domain-containing protein n=1 Tax=Stylophora pistillata TaxID=50429 RepID=A0A2B4R3F4_STYPI|nr:hypothetical protein AWC38_SpisGene24504 [Stylophora pistillata]
MANDLNFLIITIFTLSAVVTAYVTETVNLFYTRSVNDRDSSFRKYAVSKDHVNFITLGQEKDGKDKFFCTENTDYSDICQERFSFRYVNDTHVSFQIRNVTLPDAGLYDCHKYFSEVGVTKDPGYEHINLSVQEKPVVETKEINSTIVSRATSHHSELQDQHYVICGGVECRWDISAFLSHADGGNHSNSGLVLLDMGTLRGHFTVHD